MEKHFICFLLFCCLSVPNVNAQKFAWAKSVGGSGSEGRPSVCVDSAGSVYTVGQFTGSVDFDPGAGQTNLSANGPLDIYIQKLDVLGNLEWVKRIGGNHNNSEDAQGICTDPWGNILVTGFFNGTVDFDPGPGVSNLVSINNSDIFILKLNGDGDFLWAKSFAGTAGNIGHSIACDPQGNILCTGRFTGTTDFDPGPGTFNLVSPGSADCFVLKLDTAGNFVWADGFGQPSGAEVGFSVAVDDKSNVYVTGIFDYTVDFDPGPGTHNITSAGGPDIFTLKLNVNGELVWVRRIGSLGGEDGRTVSVDEIGNVFTMGIFGSAVDFDPGPGIYSMTPTSIFGPDMYIQKLDSAGNFLWARQLRAMPYSLAVDSSGVYTTGNYFSTVDFDPGSGIDSKTPVGGENAFIWKLNTSGDYLWAASMGGTGNHSGYSIALMRQDIITVGTFLSTGDYDPGSSVSSLTSNGLKDVFVQRLSQCVAAPNMAGIISGDTAVCPGSVKVYSVVYEPDVAYYTWSLPAGWTGTSLTSVISVNAGSGGLLSVTANNFCGSSAPQSLQITNLPVPNPAVSQSGTTLSAGPGYASYQWYMNGNPITGATLENYTALQTASYYVEVSNSEGCIGQSTAFNYIDTDIEDREDNPRLTLFPNPTNGRFYIQGKLPLVCRQVSIAIHDINGRIVCSQTEEITNGMINEEVVITHLLSGLYIVRLTSEQVNKTLRFIKNGE